MSQKISNDNNISTLEEMLDELDAKLSGEILNESNAKTHQSLNKTIEDTRGDFEELNEIKTDNYSDDSFKKVKNTNADTQPGIKEFTDEEKKQKFKNFMSASTNNIYSDSSGNRGPNVFITNEFKPKKLDPKKVESFKKMKITDSQIEQFDKFNKQRIKKAQKFNFRRNTLNTSRIRPLYAINVDKDKSQDNEPEPLIMNDKIDELEYKTTSDFSNISHYINKLKKTSKRITLALGALFAISFIWQICLLNLFDFPIFLTQQKPITYLIFNFIIIIAASCLCYDTLSSGIIALLKRKANSDTAVSLMAVGNVIQVIFLFFSGTTIANNNNVFVLTPVAVGCLFFHNIGKYMIAKRSVKNFEIVANENNNHYAVGIVSNEDLASAFTRGSANKPIVGYNRKTKFLTDFMYYSFLEDITDKIGYFLAPIGLCIAFILATISIFITDSIWIAITMFAAILCMVSNFSFLLSVNVPLSYAQKHLKKYSAALLGYEAASEFGGMDAIITSASKLFPKGTVSLTGMRVFNEHPIDDSIICTTSVLSITKSMLKDMFMGIILDNGNYLGQVDSILYEDYLGISAWVNDRRVIIGNYDMMVNHNINMPNINELKKMERTGCNIIYTAISGELTAAFMYTVNAASKIKELLASLEAKGIFLVVQTVDPIITSKKLSEIFKIDEEMFKILSAHYHKPYRKQTKHMDRDGSAVINRGDFVSFAKCIIETKKLFSTSRIGMTLSITGIFISILILILCMATNTLSGFSAINMIIFQLFCALVISMITFIRR